MFLSNRQPLILSTALLIMALAGCSWFRPNAPDTTNTPKIENKTNLYPFETSEPAIFSGDLFVTGGETETRTSYARKNAKWRFDMYDFAEPSVSRIQGEKLVQLDHPSKTFAEIPQGAIGEPASFVADMNALLLSSGEHAKFEKTETVGSIETYTATMPDRSPVTITYDTALKMIMKQHFTTPSGSGSAFELRNVKLEVDDSIFMVPVSYRKIAWKDMLGKLK